MCRDNIDRPTFNPDILPEADTDDCDDPADWPDSESLQPGEQAHLLARLEDELVGIGLRAGRLQRAAYVEAVR